VILTDKDGIVRADIPFRRAESKYSLSKPVSTLASMAVLDGQTFDPATVKYARRAQGEIFEFDRETLTLMVCSAPIPEVVYLRTRRICPTVLLWSPLAWFPTLPGCIRWYPDLEEQVELVSSKVGDVENSQEGSSLSFVTKC